MRDREPKIAAAAIFILLLVWIGGGIDPSHDFAGSAAGGVLALAGTFLLLTPLLFLVIKRVDRRNSDRTLIQNLCHVCPERKWSNPVSIQWHNDRAAWTNIFAVSSTE